MMTTLVKGSESSTDCERPSLQSDNDDKEVSRKSSLTVSSATTSTSNEINEESSWSRQSSLFSIFSRKSSISENSPFGSSFSVNNPCQASSTAGRFFGSNGFWELKDNFLSRIEAALNQSPNQTPVRTAVMKDRSVFGQPEVKISVNCSSSVCHSRLYRESSRESLETLDSGHSLSSCRISSSDLKHLETYDTLRPYRYRNHSGDGNGCDSAGIGSSIESSDVEDLNDINDESDREEDESIRCESRASSTSTSSDDSQVAINNRQTKEFMRNFVDTIFDSG